MNVFRSLVLLAIAPLLTGCATKAKSPNYGHTTAYHGTYVRGSIPDLDPEFGDFLCAVSMECGCPSESQGGNGQGPLVCKTMMGRAWPICNPFPSSAKWCQKEPQK